MHDDVAHLAPMIGTWRGRGSGHYPTIEPFEYVEEVTFGHVGKPFVAYAQKTRHAATELPLHAETGYLRPVGTDRLEVVIAQPSGIVEISVGSVDTGPDDAGPIRIEVRSQSVTTTDSAKEVTDVQRSISIDGDELSYDLWMAAVGQPFQHHLQATLRRVES